MFILFAIHKNILQSAFYRLLLLFRPSICHSWAIAVQRQLAGAAVRWMGELLPGYFQGKGSVPTLHSPSALYISSQVYLTFAMSEETTDIMYNTSYLISPSYACTVLYTVVGNRKTSRPHVRHQEREDLPFRFGVGCSG